MLLPDEKINIKRALRVFYHIHQHGQLLEGKHFLNGLSASSDHDGYTIVLSNAEVELTIFFHNKYELKSRNSLALQGFLEQLRILDQVKH